MRGQSMGLACEAVNSVMVVNIRGSCVPVGVAVNCVVMKDERTRTSSRYLAGQHPPVVHVVDRISDDHHVAVTVLKVIKQAPTGIMHHIVLDQPVRPVDGNTALT